MVGFMSHTLISCGVNQYEGLGGNVASTVRHMINTVAPANNGRVRCAMLIFSDVVDSKGEEIAQYITDNDLGEVHYSPEAMNPNSGNNIVLYIWILPDFQTLRNFVR